MKIAFSVMMVVLLSAAVSYLIFRIGKGNEEDGARRLSAFLLSISALSVIVSLFNDDITSIMTLSGMLPSAAGLLVLTSSLWEYDKSCVVARSMAFLGLAVLLCLVSFAMEWITLPSQRCAVSIVLGLGLFTAGLLVSGVVMRLRNVKAVMKTGTVWANAALAVDIFYVLVYFTLLVLHVYMILIVGDGAASPMSVSLLLSGLLAAMGIRVADETLFAIWRSQERRIVESMKVNKVESAVDPSSIEDVYQEIYERVLAYFENEKPFLDSRLTINDLVRVLYSNKLYVSRAISQYTGRNFCQFVNYYRVIYSMEIFRENPDMKIQELAVSCGFNSDVSYNMAFRLFMGETPGEWCRKERNRLIKLKK